MSSEVVEHANEAQAGVGRVVDPSIPQFTLRALLFGMVLGALLSLCNIYMGLKIGWGANMSITAALLGFGVFRAAQVFGSRKFGILENNINQTAAGAGASVASGGLVSAIPALTMLTGETLSWVVLTIWVFCVSLIGIVVAVGMRRQLIDEEKLPFPMGVATAKTLEELYAQGKEAMQRVWALVGSASFAAAIYSLKEIFKLPKFGPNFSFPVSSEALAAKGITAISLRNLTFAIDPGVMMIAVGAIIGMRAALSMLFAAIVGWGWIAPTAVARGWAPSGAADPLQSWFGPLVQWMLWPGVAMMVAASLTSVALSYKSFFRRSSSKAASSTEISKRGFLLLLAGALLIGVVSQIWIFGIGFGTAVLAVVLTFLLAAVAARVSGETGITPVGAMGKVTQLCFGVLAPSNVTANLMSANVTGGAATQCADMLHDLKTGSILGAWPRYQVMSQILGVVSGALLGAAGYLFLVPDPKSMLLTPEWPAPAVAQWKAVAELFQSGLSSMPEGTMGWTGAIAIASAIGIVLAVLEKRLPKEKARWLPSPAAMGLALVVPAEIAVAFFIGAVIAWLLTRFFKSWTSRFLIVIASGLVAGESMTGVGFAVAKVFQGG